MHRHISLYLAAFWMGCSSGGSGVQSEPTRKWICSDTGGVCSCDAFLPKPGTVTIGDSNLHCTGFGCCILSETQDSASPATCSCLDGVASCADEASSRRGTVVKQCPPEAEDTTVHLCAAQGENCRPDYLQSKHLEGCCDGSLCKLSAAGTPVCQAATPDEVTLWRKCMKGSTPLADILTMTPLKVATSVGMVELTNVAYFHADVGPGGCLNKVKLSLGSSALLCALDLDVAVQNGKLAVTRVFADLTDCAGYTGDPIGNEVLVDDPSLIPFEFAFTGLTCPDFSSTPSYQIAGTFDFHLNGTLENVTFGEQHIKFDAVSGVSVPSGVCPTP
jgi:hypothetical protein